MSLAMYAAPFEENSYKDNDADSLINKKRQTHNKTQKKYPKENFDTQKVNSVLEKIHNNQKEEDEDNLGDFNPPPPPESAGVNKTINTTEHMSNMSNEYNQNNQNVFRTLGKPPQPNYDNSDNLDLNNFNMNYGDNKSIEEYYKKVLPGYNGNMNTKNINSINKPYYNVNQNDFNNNLNDNGSKDILLQKLNYMIHLLEEKQDEKTNNVTEEVVLYSFLGIFIIFVVDSFARAGKYMR